nr:NADH dehydrogenase subunit 1 [Pseudolycoriella hygida]
MFLNEIFLMILSSLMLIIFLLVGVAFLTLFERKVLGYIQLRKGPNKVGILGFPQPFSDAIKLFCKEQTYPFMSNYYMYYFSPIFSLFLSLLIWMSIPYFIKMYSFNLGILFFLCCLSVGVYTILISGWSSNSNYALLGALRSVAQTISYEVSLSLILISLIFLIMSFNMMYFFIIQKYMWLIFISLPLCLCWFSSSLAETNRSPFDFSEGESELVSGFNVEYSSGGFALIFLSEYSSIIFMSMFFSLIFLGGNLFSFLFYLKLSFMCFLFIWVRGSLPRFRYDKLMYLAWKSYLPISLFYLLFFFSFKMLIISLV